MPTQANNLTSPLRLLFIGNSATYVNDIPGTLSQLAEEAGYKIEHERLVKGGMVLSTYADPSGTYGQRALELIQKGFDVVFIQDNGNCIASDEMRAASQAACKTLSAAIHASGAKVGIYFRPPYGYESWGFEPAVQALEFDKHFGEISNTVDALNVYVNRAFACAIKKTEFDLWGPDHAHTSAHGAYLAVCVFFASLFKISSTALGTNGLPEADSHTLQEIADQVVLNGAYPW